MVFTRAHLLFAPYPPVNPQTRHLVYVGVVVVVGGEVEDVIVDVFVAFVGGFGVGNGSGEGGAFVEGAIHALHVSVTQIHMMRRNHGVTRRNNHVTDMDNGTGHGDGECDFSS